MRYSGYMLKFSRFLVVVGLMSIVVKLVPKVEASYYTTKIVPSSYVNLGTPRDMITLPGGFLWYVDSQNFRIVKVNSVGSIVRTVGREGSDEGEFEYMPTSITRDNDGFLYVTTLRKVYKFDFNGGYINSWGVYGGGIGELSEPKTIHYSNHGNFLIVSNSANNRISIYSLGGDLIREFGALGSADGEFDAPHGLTTDSSGNIYVVDTNNQRVQVFDESGVFVRKFGTSVAGDYQFVFPKDVAILSNGDILVTSQNAPLVKKFNSSGVYLSEWGTNGTSDDQFVSPEFLSIASDDTVWVSDWNQKRLQHFDNDGTYIAKVANNGIINGVFTNPFSLDFDSIGNIYVLDSTGRVQKFNSEGEYLSTIIAAGEVGSAAYHLAIQPSTGNILVSSEATVKIYDPSGNFITAIGTQGLNGAAAGSGDFNHARGMVFDSSGYLYVADLFNNRIQKFDLTEIENPDFGTTYSGGFVGEWSTINFVEHLAIDVDDYIYASPPDAVEENTFTIPIVKYNSSGVVQGNFLNDFGADPGQYYQVGGIEVDQSGGMYVADKYFNRVLYYDSNGVYVEAIGSAGSDLDQFANVHSPKINPIDGSIVIADTDNHRIQILNDGSKIHNLIPSADVINSTNSASLVRSTVNPTVPEASNLSAKLYFGEYVVSDFLVDLSSDRDWASVNAIILPNESKALVVNLNPSDAPGVSATHSLYVVKQVNQSSVRVCSEATTIAQVADGCVGYNLSQGDPDLETVSIGGVDYWRISGLTGTGAYSVADETPSPTPTPNPNSNQNSQTQTNQGGGDSNSTNNSTCSDVALGLSPDLFQISTTATTAKIYFAPASGVEHYIVSYSNSPDKDEYSTEIFVSANGVAQYTINYLKPLSIYYFKIRGQSGCQPGPWSEMMRVVTKPRNSKASSIFYKYSSRIGQVGTQKTQKNAKIKLPNPSPQPSVSEEVKKVDQVKTMVNQVETKKKCVKFLWWCF